MSSCNRRTLILAPLALAACGFTPAYAPGGAATRLMGTVRAADPSDKNGFDFVERIEERLGRPEAAAMTWPTASSPNPWASASPPTTASPATT